MNLLTINPLKTPIANVNIENITTLIKKTCKDAKIMLPVSLSAVNCAIMVLLIIDIVYVTIEVHKYENAETIPALIILKLYSFTALAPAQANNPINVGHNAYSYKILMKKSKFLMSP